MVHIGLITPSFPPMVDGGVAIATGRLAAGLQARGHRVTVLTSAPSLVVAEPCSGLDDVTIYGGVMPDPLRDTTAMARVCEWAQAYHRMQPFDVLLAYFVYPAGYVATGLGECLEIPVVCSCRGNDISKDIFIDPQTVATVLQRSTRLVFVCASLLHMADTLVPCRRKSTVVANAVDCAAFAPALPSVRRAPHPVILGTSGLMRWKKGLDLLLPLVRELCAADEAHFLVAGYGLDAEIDLQIADFLASHGLQERFEMCGPIPHARMVEALHRMDIYVTTSYQEGMPNGVLEAMACALPVVATAADGIPAVVVDGVTGYLCAMGDLPALVARCRQLMRDPALRRRMGQAGRQRVQQHFQPDREVEAVEAVLQAACGI